jgi:hypothetical protein
MGFGSGGGAQAMQMVGTGLKMYGAYKEGRDTYKSYKYNESVMKQEGDMALRSAEMEKLRIQREKYLTGGQQKAGYAKRGVVANTGSPYEVMVDTAAQYEMDKSITDYNAKIQKMRAESQALQYGRAAKAAFSAGKWKMANILVDSMSKQKFGS